MVGLFTLARAGELVPLSVVAVFSYAAVICRSDLLLVRRQRIVFGCVTATGQKWENWSALNTYYGAVTGFHSSDIASSAMLALSHVEIEPVIEPI